MSISEFSPLLRNQPNNILSNYLAISSQIHIEGKVDEMKSSPIRRTFCLIVLVDLVMCSLSWILRVHLNSKTITFNNEILEYYFGRSLFDIFVLAIVRFVFLEVLYGGIKSKSLWWISISTSVSSGFVVVKMFMSSFRGPTPQYLPDFVDYLSILLTFLFVWIETIFLVCRMLPKERAAEQVMAYQKVLAEQFTSNQQLMTPHYPGSEVSDRVSLTVSLDEDEFLTPAPTRPDSPTNFRAKEIQSMANQLQHKAMSVIRDNTGWTYATGDAIQGCVSHKEIMTFKGKMFKIETLLSVPAKVLYNDIITNFERSPEWNQHVRLVKKIENISSNVDIIYNLSNEALNGYISPRDYVLLRTWGVVEQSYLISFTSFLHNDCPPEPNVVRGEYGLGAIFLQSNVDLTDQCRCIWLMNNDIKGRLFKSIVDRAVPGILLEIIGGLRQHCATLRQ